MCRAEVEYKRPAPLNAVVKVETQVKEIKAASCLSEQRFYVEDQLAAIVHIEAVSVDAKTLRPKRIPADVKALYLKYQEEK